MKTLLTLSTCLCVLGLSAMTCDAAIFLDFGDGTVAAGTEQGPAGFSGTWQAPTNSGSDQTLTDGETLRLVRGGNNTSTALTWGSNGNPAENNNNAPPGGSIQATEGNVYRDYLRNGDNGRSLGLRLSGLNPGIYDVYVVPNDASTEAGSQLAIGVLEGDAGDGPFEISDLAQTTAALIADADRSLAIWTNAAAPGAAFNYLQATIVIDEMDDFIVVFMESARGTGAVNQMGIASFQLVEVPEPTTAALLGLAGLALMRGRRRLRS